MAISLNPDAEIGGRFLMLAARGITHLPENEGKSVIVRAAGI